MCDTADLMAAYEAIDTNVLLTEFEEKTADLLAEIDDEAQGTGQIPNVVHAGTGWAVWKHSV